jgi:hypothetical protein
MDYLVFVVYVNLGSVFLVLLVDVDRY